MNWQEIIPSKVAIKFNKPTKIFHYFSLGEIVNGTVFPFSKTTKYKVEINVVNNPQDYAKGEYEQFSSFYKVGKDWILYQRKYGGFSCQLYIKDLDKDEFKVYVNSFYINFIKAKIDSLYPVGVHVTDILLYKIIRDKDLVIHGASLYDSKNKRSFLLVAPPDTGKTYTTYMLLKKGYKFLGEDLSYYDGKTDELQSMPYTSTWGHRFKLQAFDPSKIPFAGLMLNTAKKGVEDIFGKDSVRKSAHLDRIYILEKTTGEESITKAVVNEELMRKVMAIQRNEFTYFKNPLLRAYEYYHPMDIDKVYATEAENMYKLFHTKEVFVVRAQHHERYEILIAEHSNS